MLVYIEKLLVVITTALCFGHGARGDYAIQYWVVLNDIPPERLPGSDSVWLCMTRSERLVWNHSGRHDRLPLW